MPDELLRPTIGAGVDLSVRPWRLMSQTYVAFFGGALAATVIAYVNSGRLGLDAAARRLILVTGAAGLVASTLVYLALEDLLRDDDPYAAVANVAATAIALVTSFVQQRIQRLMDRAFQWKAGITATIIGAATEILIIFLVELAL
jgi:putative flippase GtrA